jgi:predicted nicotinamide N-methyase
VLSKFLAQNSALVCGKMVIELGAGTGLLGISCHKLGAKIVSTDHENFLTNLEKNFLLNHIDPKKHCKALNWGSDIQKFLDDHELSPPHVVLGADIVYVEETFELLMKTLLDISKTKKSTKIFLACQIRYGKDEKFIEDSKEHFRVDIIPQSLDDNIKIFCLTQI